LGYAFLNFTTHERAVAFMHQFDGVRLPSAGSRKVCSVVWANKQGLFQHSNPPTVKDTMPSVPSVVASEMPTCKIFVGGLPTSTTEADLVDYFAKFGPIREASIVTNRQTGQSRGFGFCEFHTPDSVDRVQAAQARIPHSINCRIVSVRPYNVQQYSGDDSTVPMSAGTVSHGGYDTQPSGVTSFLMGHGGSIIRYDSVSSSIAGAMVEETGFASSIHYPFISY
jgi:quinol monooxygenase YgiN